jgi:DNA-binding XRE family transcriptional regulator
MEKNHVALVSASTSEARQQKRGRPPKQDAKTDAELSREYRRDLKKRGKKAINAHLSDTAKATLTRICKVKSMTIAEAIEWALDQAVRLDAIERSNGPSGILGYYQRRLSEKLKDARLAAAYTELDMAERIDAPMSRYVKWEKGLEKIPEKYLVAVVRLLSLPQDFFREKTA